MNPNKLSHQGIKGNVWHPVTHIREYLNLGLSLLYIYYGLDYQILDIR